MSLYPEFANSKIPNAYPADWRNTAVLTGEAQALAAAGSTKDDAAAIAATTSLVSGADAAKGVIIPAGEALGRSFVVVNNAAAVLKVYPPTGGQINNAGADTAYSLAANSAKLFLQASDGLWFVV